VLVVVHRDYSEAIYLQSGGSVLKTVATALLATYPNLTERIGSPPLRKSCIK
jgi:hypothetical protein